MLKILSGILFFSSLLFSQSNFQNFINYVNSLPDPSSKSAAVDSFMTYAQQYGIPYIEDSTANFIYRGNVNTVDVRGDFNGWGSGSNMTKLNGTNFFYYSRNFELNARLDYKFVTNGSNWILDPLNPNQVSGGFGPNSELAMPQYVQPWEINYNPGIPHGTVVTRSVFSTNTNSTYQVRVYLPPGYNSATSNRYPVVYFQDGFEYIDLAKAVNVIDNLTDSLKITPVIAVFVRPNNRNEEYAFSLRNQYRLFFVNELVPLIDNDYRTIADPSKRLVLGDSFGGNISALISYNHPEVFGNCGLHSGAFWPNNYETYNLIVNGPKKEINFTAVWGTYESLYTNMRQFRDSLISMGYSFEWLELPEGHSWGLWRATIDVILTSVFPYGSVASVEEEQQSPDNYILLQNYPNPFNPSTTIRISVPAEFNRRDFKLSVYDVLGRELAVLLNTRLSAGVHEVHFDIKREGINSAGSGILFIRLLSDEISLTNSMILLK